MACLAFKPALYGFRTNTCHDRLYDLDKKEAVATGGFQKEFGLKLPNEGGSFFLLVAP
jgi:hypothetical protein